MAKLNYLVFSINMILQNHINMLSYFNWIIVCAQLFIMVLIFIIIENIFCCLMFCGICDTFIHDSLMNRKFNEQHPL